jgi:hypothetical protein
MTPIWRKAVAEGLKSKDPNVRLTVEAIASTTHCFDLSPVATLLTETAKELGRAYSGPIDLGEGVVFPAESFWIEWPAFGLVMARWGGLDRKGLAIWAFRAAMEPLWPQGQTQIQQYVQVGHIFMGADGLFTIATGPHHDVAERAFGRGVEGILLHALAAIAIINSPSAKRVDQAPHKGVQRHLRQAFPAAPTVKPSKIVIALDRPAADDGEPGHANSRRAYHFCRAHSRMKAGRTEHVRAHWRGDPAFGIRIGRYEVRQSPPAGERQ